MLNNYYVWKIRKKLYFTHANQHGTVMNAVRSALMRL